MNNRINVEKNASNIKPRLDAQRQDSGNMAPNKDVIRLKADLELSRLNEKALNEEIEVEAIF